MWSIVVEGGEGTLSPRVKELHGNRDGTWGSAAESCFELSLGSFRALGFCHV